jgi:hypothetical protein
MFECLSSSLWTFKSVPLALSNVEYVCLKVCQPTRLVMPAHCAAGFTIFTNALSGQYGSRPRVERQFDPTGDAELFEDLEQVVLDRMATQFQRFNSVAISRFVKPSETSRTILLSCLLKSFTPCEFVSMNGLE